MDSLLIRLVDDSGPLPEWPVINEDSEVIGTTDMNGNISIQPGRYFVPMANQKIPIEVEEEGQEFVIDAGYSLEGVTIEAKREQNNTMWMILIIAILFLWLKRK